ncbi:hypothetical protein C4J93_2925 [Pseudomonas sp. R2-37-08W]|nr:hypothetical protein C4J93_2925 [Pseudomonas sp. R2-37-08W]
MVWPGTKHAACHAGRRKSRCGDGGRTRSDRRLSASREGTLSTAARAASRG